MTDPNAPPAVPPSPPVPSAVFGALQASGFPFQTAVEHGIRTAINWKVLAVEVPWTDPSGADQFLDLVARSGQYTIGVECKKTQKETLTFLLPQEARATTVDRAWLLYADQIRDSTRRWEPFRGLWRVGPASFESSFCVVSTSGSGKDQRLLERDVGRLILGTDAYAQRARRGIPVSAADELGWPFVPVLVTNAPLYVARYEPTDVSLDTGEFASPPTNVDAVPWVRFRKSFPSSGRLDLGERTAFVVTATRLAEFLVELGETISGQPPPGAPRTHLPGS